MTVVLKNWWCPKCKEWRASADLNEARRCSVCNERASFEEFRPTQCSFRCDLEPTPRIDSPALDDKQG